MDEAVRANSLTVSLGGRKVLEKITLSVRYGEMTGVIGPNGAGKTTLLRALLGLVPLEAGELTVLGASGGGLKEIRPQIGYMPQRQSFEKRFPLSAADVVATGLLSPATLLRRLPDHKGLTGRALASVGMKFYMNRPFANLSGGEQQRILLARSLVRKPKLLLLDEPNSGLDFPAQRGFLDLLVKLKEEENLAIVLVSHDLISVASAADQLVCINRTMHVHGRPTEVLHSPHLDDAYRCQFDFLSSTAGEKGCKR
jgi:ABC-type Mn2+/Zn2+ transport system ATPase subunit